MEKGERKEEERGDDSSFQLKKKKKKKKKRGPCSPNWGKKKKGGKKDMTNLRLRAKKRRNVCSFMRLTSQKKGKEKGNFVHYYSQQRWGKKREGKKEGILSV